MSAKSDKRIYPIPPPLPEFKSIFDPCIEEAQKLFDFYGSITRETNQAVAHCVEVDRNSIDGSGFGCADAEDRKFIRSAQSPLWPSSHAGVTEHISLGPCRLTVFWEYPYKDRRSSDDVFRLKFSIRLEDQKITALYTQFHRTLSTTGSTYTRSCNLVIRWTRNSDGVFTRGTLSAVSDIADFLTDSCRYVYIRALVPETVRCLAPAPAPEPVPAPAPEVDVEYEIVQLTDCA